jgi:hypothetical protein
VVKDETGKIFEKHKQERKDQPALAVPLRLLWAGGEQGNKQGRLWLLE